MTTNSSREISSQLEFVGAETPEDDVVGLVARWAGRRASFALVDLREHLLLNEAVTADDVAGVRLRALLDTIAEDVVAYHAQRGSRVKWLYPNSYPPAPGSTKSSPKYALGYFLDTTEEVEQTKVAPARRRRPVSAPTSNPTPTVQPEMNRVADETIEQVVQLVSDADREIVPARVVFAALQEMLGVDGSAAKEIVQATIAAGRLFKRNAQGSSGLTANPALSASNLRKVEVAEATQRNEAEALADMERFLQTSNFVMRALSVLKDINMGQPYNKLWKQAGNLQSTMDFEEFKRQVRRMEEEGLVTIIKNARLHTKTGRSKELYGSKVVAASQEVKGRWKVNAKKEVALLREKVFDTLAQQL